MLDKLSIVIPTYERQNFCLRSIEYWNELPLNVYILDGSKKALDKSIQESLSKNINYLHLPISLYERMALSTELVSTEYAAFLSDDEFFTVEGMHECIKELELNKELVTCSGNVMAFNFKKNKVFGFDVYGGLRNYSVAQDDVYQRLDFHLNKNFLPSTLFGISRTNFWKDAVNYTFRKEFICYAMWEIQMESFLHLFGKSKVIDKLLWLRSKEVEPIRGTSPSMSVENSFNNWWNSKEFEDEKKEFINIFAEINELRNLNLVNISANIEKIYDVYSNKQKARKEDLSEQERKYNFFLKRAQTNFFDLFPDLRVLLKKILGKYSDSDPIDIIKYVKVLQDKGISVDRKNIEEIIFLIKKYK